MTIDEQASGLRKAAVLLLQMGKAGSAKVLSQLHESEVEALSAEIVRLGDIDIQVTDAVLDEFHAMARTRNQVAHGGLDFARELLVETLGQDRADEIVERIGTSMVDVPFRFLQNADHRQVLTFLEDEHPQTIALVVAHMPPQLAALVLAGLPAEQRGDVALRLATLGHASPDVIRRIESLMEAKLATLVQPGDGSTIGGVKPLVNIINQSDRATERSILDGLSRLSPELADEVRSQMFLFEDLVGIDDRSIQIVLREVEAQVLAAALKGVSEKVRDKVLTNLSERAAENLVEEVDVLGAIRLSKVEEAQAKVIAVIRRFEESGQIVLRRGDDDDALVS